MLRSGKQQQVMTTEKTSTATKVLGSLSPEVCFKMTSFTPGRGASYSFTPKAPLLLMSSQEFPGSLAPQLENLENLQDHAVTSVLAPRQGEASWPINALSQMKIKLHDRFRRHVICIVLDAAVIQLGTTQLFQELSPGISLVLETAESPPSVVRLQVAINKRHLRADVWKYHFSTYYTPVPRKISNGMGPLAAAAASCMRTGCTNTSAEMRLCPCGMAIYCSDEHAAEDWYAGHSQMCKAATSGE